MALSSYDRLSPAHDFLPVKARGGFRFGSLLALPMHGASRFKGTTVFVDPGTIGSRTRTSSPTCRRPSGCPPPTSRRSSTSSARSGLARPRSGRAGAPAPPQGSRQGARARCGPARGDAGGVSTAGLPPQLLVALKHAASFHNPEFYRKQNQRFSTFNTPRLVCCFDASDPDWLKLPRGLADEAAQLIAAGGTLDITSDLPEPAPITAHFTGELTATQQRAVETMAEHPAGTLVAPPGSGKTLMACTLIAHHRVPTAVIVNRAELLTQWKERLAAFLDLGDGHIGSLGGGKDRRGHVVDLIMLQTLSHRDAPDDLLAGYGLVIVDECHAVGAPGAEAAIRTAKAPRWVGLSATPYRADQMDPVITMQCGPIRHEIEEASTFAKHLIVHTTAFTTDEPGNDGASIQAIYNELAHAADRNQLIAANIADAARRGRCSLALTNRVEHLHQLTEALQPHGVTPLILHGGMPPAERARIRAALTDESDGPLVLLAIDKLAGEGFDAPRLDTLFLTSPSGEMRCDRSPL